MTNLSFQFFSKNLERKTKKSISYRLKTLIPFITSIIFLFGAMPKVKAAYELSNNDLIGQGFAFVNIGKETTMSMMLSYSVTNTNDASAGSLRQAMLDAITADVGRHDITFDRSLCRQTINISSDLPILSVSGISINGNIDGDNTPDNTIATSGGDVKRNIFCLDGLASNASMIVFNIKNKSLSSVSVSGNPTEVTFEDIAVSNDAGNFLDHAVLWNDNANDITIRNFTMSKVQNYYQSAIRFF